MISNKQADYYNKIATRYSACSTLPEALAYRYSVYDSLLRDVPLAGAKVLDAMCGSGEASGYFRDRMAKLAALDVSHEMCRLYAERIPGVEVRCERVESNSFPDNEFDLVVTDSLHHTQPEAVGAFLNGLLRVTKPSGRVFLYEPNAEAILDLLRRAWYRLDPKYFENNEASIHARRFMEAVGDRVSLEQLQYGGHLAYLLVQQALILRIPKTLVRTYGRWLTRLEFALPSPGRYLGAWVGILIRKR